MQEGKFGDDTSRRTGGWGRKEGFFFNVADNSYSKMHIKYFCEGE